MPTIVTVTLAKGTPCDGQQLTFTSHDNFVVGQMEDCRCRLADDPAVSDYHCIIEVNPPEARIRDLSSETGTWVNGRRIGAWDAAKSSDYGSDVPYPGVDLQDGDVVRIGHAELIIGGKTEDDSKAVTCRSCGRDASAEAKGKADDYYFCQSCRDTIAMDPERRLLVAAARAGGLVPLDGSWDDTPMELAGCRIQRPIGRNPYGVVYSVERIVDGEEAALKIVLPQVPIDEASHQKYLEEVGVMKGLKQNQTVELLDVGSLGGAFYFVTECCAGTNILNAYRTAKIEKWRPWCRMVLSQALEGLACAHERGKVHGHIWIGNILVGLTAEGHEMGKTADLATAWGFDAHGFGGMTLTGPFAQGPFWIPRERLLGTGCLTARSDLWAAGATYFSLLTEHPPYKFTPDVDPLAIILKGNPTPVRDYDPRVPGKLAAVIDQAVQPDPKNRFEKARDLQFALATEGMFTKVP